MTRASLTGVSMTVVSLAMAPSISAQTVLEEVVVTGSRIRQNPLDNRTPIQTFTEEVLLPR